MNSAAQASERPMHNHSRFCFTVSSSVCDMHERCIAIVLPTLHAARAIHDRCKTRHSNCCGGTLLLSPSRPIDVENPCKPHARNSCTFPFINTACIASLQATTTCMEPFNLPRFVYVGRLHVSNASTLTLPSCMCRRFRLRRCSFCAAHGGAHGSWLVSPGLVYILYIDI